MGNPINGKTAAVGGGDRVAIREVFLFQQFVDVGLLGEMDCESIVGSAAPGIVNAEVPLDGPHKINSNVRLKASFKPAFSLIVFTIVNDIIHIDSDIDFRTIGCSADVDAGVMLAGAQTDGN